MYRASLLFLITQGYVTIINEHTFMKKILPLPVLIVRLFFIMVLFILYAFSLPAIDSTKLFAQTASGCTATPPNDLPTLKSQLLSRYGVNITIATDTTTAIRRGKLIFQVLCKVWVSPAYVHNLNSTGTGGHPINVQVGGSGSNCFAWTTSGSDVQMVEPCDSDLIYQYIIIHEFTHVMQKGGALGRNSHQTEWQAQVWGPASSPPIPTGPCVLELGHPDSGECQADAVAEFVYYKDYRNSWSGQPPGGSNLTTYPTQWPAWYSFAQKQIFGFSTNVNFYSLPLPSLSPSLSPLPSISPVITSAITNLSFTIYLHGIGLGGDNVTPNGGGNTLPLHQQRKATVTMLNANNMPVLTLPFDIVYSSTSGNFAGSVNKGNLADGSYLATIKVDNFLPKQLPGIIQITSGQAFVIPSVYVVTGDINNDNQLDILDYNLLVSCFGSKQTSSTCMTPPTQLLSGSDINDDGKVDGFDYNLFLRELSVQHGGL